MPVERRGSGYHDAALSSLSSATAVRAALARGDLPAALSAVPSPAPLQTAEARGSFLLWEEPVDRPALLTGVHEEEALTQALLYRLRTASPDALAALYGMDEGLERRFLAAAQTCASREALLDFVKTKRYTRARLNRLCAHAMLGLTRALAERHPTPEYARLIGMREDAHPLLCELKRRAQIPIVSSPKALVNSEVFALEARATDLRALCMNAPEQRTQNAEWTTKFVRV